MALQPRVEPLAAAFFDVRAQIIAQPHQLIDLTTAVRGGQPFEGAPPGRGFRSQFRERLGGDAGVVGDQPAVEEAAQLLHVRSRRRRSHVITIGGKQTDRPLLPSTFMTGKQLAGAPPKPSFRNVLSLPGHTTWYLAALLIRAPVVMAPLALVFVGYTAGSFALGGMLAAAHALGKPQAPPS